MGVIFGGVETGLLGLVLLSMPLRRKYWRFISTFIFYNHFFYVRMACCDCYLFGCLSVYIKFEG